MLPATPFPWRPTVIQSARPDTFEVSYALFVASGFGHGKGICPALCGWVVFYDILQDGFHTPLSAHQIADLFHAGRLGRNTPCRRAEKKEWRTVDELFPLLKYQSATIGYDSSSEPADLSPKTWALVCAFLAVACAIAALW
jgi:hypothetical protein